MQTSLITEAEKKYCPEVMKLQTQLTVNIIFFGTKFNSEGLNKCIHRFLNQSNLEGTSCINFPVNLIIQPQALACDQLTEL